MYDEFTIRPFGQTNNDSPPVIAGKQKAEPAVDDSVRPMTILSRAPRCLVNVLLCFSLCLIASVSVAAPGSCGCALRAHPCLLTLHPAIAALLHSAPLALLFFVVLLDSPLSLVDTPLFIP